MACVTHQTDWSEDYDYDDIENNQDAANKQQQRPAKRVKMMMSTPARASRKSQKQQAAAQGFMQCKSPMSLCVEKILGAGKCFD